MGRIFGNTYSVTKVDSSSKMENDVLLSSTCLLQDFKSFVGHLSTKQLSTFLLLFDTGTLDH